MHTHRFGKRIKLPSTIAIKHQLRKLMFEDLVKEAEARAEVTRRSLSENDGTARGTASTASSTIAAKPTAELMRAATGNLGVGAVSEMKLSPLTTIDSK